MTEHIKIYGVKPRIQYIADGNLKKYEFPFAIFKTSDIDVYFNDKLQDQSTYSVFVTPDLAGGEVSFETAPTSGTMITIIRNLSIERTTDFQEGGALRAEVLNTELDYQIACQQQIADNLNRSMVLPPYAVDTDVDLTLPTPSAGKAIVWNKDGTNLENSVVEVNALESVLKGYKETAQNAATTAINKADIATAQAQTATTQAGIATAKAEIATQKATEVSNALSTKANTTLDNLTASGKEQIGYLGMPDGTRYINETLPENGGTYTAPANGYLIFDKRAGEAGKYICLLCGGMTTCNFTGFGTGTECKAILPVKKNDVVTVRYTATGATEIFRFVYAKGSV